MSHLPDLRAVEPLPRHRAHALVVAADEHVRRVLRERLIRDDYSVSVAASSPRALEVLAHGVDLVLLGDPLPEHGRSMLLERMRAVDPDVEVILVGADGPDPRPVETVRVGDARVLRTSLDPDQVAALAGPAVELAQLRRAVRDDRTPVVDVYRLPPDGVVIEELERTLVVQALARTQGNRTRAASLLGMNRDQIRYRVDKYGLRDVDWSTVRNGA